MGIPKAITSDDGEESKGRCKQILDSEGIDHIIMTTNLSCIDRLTRTITNMLFERVDHTKKDWHLLLPNVIKQYSNTLHDSTRLKPIDAIKDSNAPDVKTNLTLWARVKRKNKEIHVGDFNRIFWEKPKYSDMKEHVKNWSDKTCEVVGIDKSGLNGQTIYKFEGLNKPFLESKLLAVEWIHCLILRYNKVAIVI